MLMAGLYLAAGVLHFVLTSTYMKIMPPYLPEPKLLVEVSGVAEIMGGVGLVLPETRRAAAWGIIALLVAVSPANVQMALDHAKWPGIPVWLLWARVPLQVPLIWWAYQYTRDSSEKLARSTAS